MAGDQATLVARLRQIEEPLAVWHEASCGYSRLHDLLDDQARRMVVAHPANLG